MLPIAKDGKQHVTSCQNNQVYEPHVLQCISELTPVYYWLLSRKERNINSCSSNQSCLVRRGFTHPKLSTSHMVTTAIT